jgi:hypothetical protein
MCCECREELEKNWMTDAIARLPDTLSHLRPSLRSKVDSGPVISRLMEAMGGEALGQRYAEKLEQVLSAPDVSFKEVRQWLNGAMRLIQRQEQLDRAKETPLGDLTDDELRDRLRPIAIHLMQTDPDFYNEVIAACQNIVTVVPEAQPQPEPPTEEIVDEISDEAVMALAGEQYVDQPDAPNLPEAAE